MAMARHCYGQSLSRDRSDVFVGTGIPGIEIVWIARAGRAGKQTERAS
jgi:hypothetical protein